MNTGVRQVTLVFSVKREGIDVQHSMNSITAPESVRPFILFVVSLAAVLLLSGPRRAFSDHWARYTSINHVNDIAVSGDDVWCATGGGMVRWNIRDGSHEVYMSGLFDRTSFSAVEIDNYGNVWCGKKSFWFPLPGLLKFDGESWIEIPETTAHTVSAMAISADNAVWFGNNESHIICWDGYTLTEYGENEGYTGWNIVDDIAIDGNGVVWVASTGIWKYDGSEWIHYTKENSDLLHDNIDGLAIDGLNRLWIGFGTSDISLQCFDGETWNCMEASEDVSGRLGGQRTLRFAPDGALWMARYGGGINRIAGGEITFFSSVDGLAYDAVTCIVVTEEGDVWSGSDGYGISRFDGSCWSVLYDDGCPADNDIRDIAVDTRNVKWFGTGRGVCSFDGERWRIHDEAPLRHVPVSTAAAGPDGSVWFGAYRMGVVRFDGLEWRVFSPGDGLVSNDITDLAVDYDNILWVCTPYGISAFDDGTWHTYTVEDGLTHSYVKAVAVDRDNVKWFGISDKAVMSYDGVSWTTYDEPQGMVYSQYNDIAAASGGIVWFASAPILSFDSGKWNRIYPDLNVCNRMSVAVDGNDIVWFGGGFCTAGGMKIGGVLRYDGCSWSFRDELDGIPVLCIAVDHDNLKWFGTFEGVWSLDDRGTGVAAQPLAAETCTINGVRPNPFNGSAVLSFSLSGSCRAEVDIFNVAGQKVRTLIGERLPAGRHEAVWDGRGDNGGIVSSGVYILRLRDGNSVRCVRAVFVK